MIMKPIFSLILLAGLVGGCVSFGDNSVRAEADHNTLLYEDGHVRLVEVTYPPKNQVVDQGSPYPAVLAFSAVQPRLTETPLNGSRPAARTEGGALPNADNPRCATVAPEPPRRVENNEGVPAHFYRIEYKRLDGAGFATQWATLYPFMKRPMTLREWFKISGEKKPFGQAADTQPKHSGDSRTLNPTGYPYPDSSDAVAAAPGQHWLRFENQNVRLLEVTYRPGEYSDVMHGHAYPSVIALDNLPIPKAEDEKLDPKRASTEGIGQAGPPAGMNSRNREAILLCK